MKAKDSLYIQSLLWAYEKRHTGFTRDEMKIELKISEEEWPWVQWMFFNGIGGDSPLAWRMSTEYTQNGEIDHNRFYLTAMGIAATVDYLELKEAQASGKRATKIAIVSIVIGVIVGITQIYVQLCY